MDILNTGDIIAQEGFRVAPNLKSRILEAAKLFNEGQSASNPFARARLLEAFTTDDFPILLSKAFEYEAIAAQKNAVREFDAIAYQTTLADFRKKKLRDLFGQDVFDDVAEGEEYKGGSLDETEVEISIGKTGRNYGFTWELRINGDFDNLAQFPTRLGNAAVNTVNQKIAEVLADGDGWREDFFGSVANLPLTPDNLQAALKELAVKEDWRGDLVDTSSMYLVVGPGMQFEANRIIGAAELEMQVTDGNKVTKTRIQNPFRGLVTVLVSRRLGKVGAPANGWALIPSKSSTLPALIEGKLRGHENVDIRVKRDQGSRVGGGDVPVEEGSFNDDTIWYRGRHVTGAAKGFTDGVYASAGQ